MENFSDPFSSALTLARGYLTMYGQPATMTLFAVGMAAAVHEGDLIVCIDPQIWRLRSGVNFDEDGSRAFLSFMIRGQCFEAVCLKDMEDTGVDAVTAALQDAFVPTDKYAHWRLLNEPRRVELVAAK